MFKYLSPLAVSVLLAACTAPAEKPLTSPDAHTSRTAVDWQGSYAGVLPCADCPGIEMKLTLNTDGRYTLSRLYQDRQSKPELVSGRFHWLPGDGAIALEGDDSRWQLGENQLSMLDTEGKVITGPLAHHYILRRTAH
ncbi:copper resistance protein NlpE [Bordetella holmesii]|uniref:NlpE N-terminal domain protein n=2 Tax=Bordetella holmesii TaxID=35814 RepID=A0A158M452_9BORD|nr:copper resistance protein NlpE [Bordetella holmesii]AIT27620.1 lipoprotein [Bordetella holmesii 44057]EWM40395.1 lipoprotein [Bordetella holmesii 35009]EWM41643.1 lipoprotein [Bordetella holmesii 41130]EWM49199.1 lipoprotein [Bordetella holmesii 70147]AMD46429.1 hypothetical protein H558_13490 [Bordetella holmesii H558]